MSPGADATVGMRQIGLGDGCAGGSPPNPRHAAEGVVGFFDKLPQPWRSQLMYRGKEGYGLTPRTGLIERRPFQSFCDVEPVVRTLQYLSVRYFTCVAIHPYGEEMF